MINKTGYCLTSLTCRYIVASTKFDVETFLATNLSKINSLGLCSQGHFILNLLVHTSFVAS